MASVVLLLALAWPACAAAAPRALPTVVQDDAQLLFQSDAQVRASLANLQALGGQWVRVTASWSDLTRDSGATREPAFDDRDPAAYEQDKWALVDRVVRLAPQYGLRVMIDVGFWAPHWAATDRASQTRPRTDVRAAPFARFAAAVARRYSGTFTPPQQAATGGGSAGGLGGLLAGLLELPAPPAPAPAPATPLPAATTLSLWNEPNEPVFLAPQWTVRGHHSAATAPTIYRRMVAAAYPAIKAVAPHDTVLVGGLSPHGHYGRQAGDMPPLRFIRAMACVDTRLRPIRTGSCAGFRKIPGDGWTHHAYDFDHVPSHRDGRARPDNAAIGDLGRLTALLHRLVARGRLSARLRDVYVTEFGYESNPPDRTVRWSVAQQARLLTWAEYLAQRNPHVKMWAQYELRDGVKLRTTGGAQARRGYGGLQSGLLYENGVAKPAARAFAAGLFASRRGGRVLLWGRLRAPGVRSAHIEARGARGGWRALATSARPGGRAVAGFAPAAAFQRYARRGRGVVFYRVAYVDAAGRHVGVAVPLA